VTIERSTVAVGSLVESAVLWAIAFALVAVNEELVFRGCAFFRLLRGTNPVVATLVTSSAFALAHIANPSETISGILSVVASGLVLCLSVWRSGSLWWAIGFHAAWDWSQSFVFGVADSGLLVTGHWLTSQAVGPAWLNGGSAGPEGSVLVFPILAALALVIVRTLPPAKIHLTLRKPQAR
jgi:membrane protease YdiL (CAAX protease family)